MHQVLCHGWVAFRTMWALQEAPESFLPSKKGAHSSSHEALPAVYRLDDAEIEKTIECLFPVVTKEQDLKHT